MIFLKRKRLIFWLIRAYLKRWQKTIFLSFITGSIIFAFLYISYPFLSSFLPFKPRESIGIVGAYTRDTLPAEVLNHISKGLTEIDKDGKPMPSIASSWVIKDNGRTYIFNLRRDVYFSDKKRLTSYLVNYNFIDVDVQRPDEDTIVFKLKDSYAPFLITVSRPVFRKDFVGVGEYKVKSFDLNGEFVESIQLVSKDKSKTLSYQFYPTEDALKIAFLLGEVSEIVGVPDINFLGTTFTAFPGFEIEKKVNYSLLVTLFYNTQDKIVSEEKVREALSYAIPDNFLDGVRNRVPYPPNLWTTSVLDIYQENYSHAKILLSQSESATKGTRINLVLKTLPKYKRVAREIQKSWGKLGIETKIEEVNTLPSTFQIFLGDFNVPKDPDQYILWHSSQPNNIARYKNLRIDKLLEDGRRTINFNERKKIYADFQKYILDDPPATFLFFPYSYAVSRR